jgi:hypothetical protein
MLRMACFVLSIAAVAMATGCARTLVGTATVPHPLGVLDGQPHSEADYDITIRIRDLKQPEGLAAATHAGGLAPSSPNQPRFFAGYVGPRYFRQSASLRVATSDVVLVDLALVDEWRELVSLDHYRIELRDDRGVLFGPDDQWMAAESHRDYEGAYQTIRNYQNVTIHDGGDVRQYSMWAPDEYYVQERIYRGRGAVVFRRPALLRSDTRSLTLTLTSRARTLRFTWIFEPTVRAGL